MTHGELRNAVNSYLKFFKKRQYATELMFSTVRHVTSQQHVTVLDKMQKFDLIRPINRLNGNEWELTPHGHEVIKYGSWKMYLFIKFIKGLVTFLGGLWTIIGTIFAVTFGYLTWTKDNELDKQKELNKGLYEKLDSVTNILDLERRQYQEGSQDISRRDSTKLKNEKDSASYKK